MDPSALGKNLEKATVAVTQTPGLGPQVPFTGEMMKAVDQAPHVASYIQEHGLIPSLAKGIYGGFIKGALGSFDALKTVGEAGAKYLTEPSAEALTSVLFGSGAGAKVSNPTFPNLSTRVTPVTNTTSGVKPDPNKPGYMTDGSKDPSYGWGQSDKAPGVKTPQATQTTSKGQTTSTTGTTPSTGAPAASQSPQGPTTGGLDAYMTDLMKGSGSTSPENVAMFNVLSKLRSAYSADPTSLEKPEVVRDIIQTATTDAKLFPDTQTGLIPDQADNQSKAEMQGFLDDVKKYTKQLLDPTTHGSLVDYYNGMLKDAGITGTGGINEQITSLQNIMMGTKNDIENELKGRGVPVTESGVAALVDKRNQLLNLKLNQLENLKQSKTEYIDNMVKFYGMDQQTADARFEKAIGLEESAAKLDIMLQNSGFKQTQFWMNYQQKQEVQAKNQINSAITGNYWTQMDPAAKQQTWEQAGFTGPAPESMSKTPGYSAPFIDGSGDLVQMSDHGEIRVVHRATAGSTGSIAGQYNAAVGDLAQQVYDGTITPDEMQTELMNQFPNQIQNIQLYFASAADNLQSGYEAAQAKNAPPGTGSTASGQSFWQKTQEFFGNFLKAPPPPNQ